MSTLAHVPVLVGRTRSAAARAVDLVESWRVPRVLAVLVVVQWLTVLGAALTIRHAGWIYYQGGDQLWYYTLGWLLSHGHLTQTPVGYGWSVVLAPFARLAGPNAVSAFPAIILFNVLVLGTVALLALYGIAARIGGRLFGYWASLLWIAVPFVGILYTNPGYHRRYTELLLPQAFGLTAMADLPSTVCALVSVYFCTRALCAERPELVDGAAAGVAAGFAFAIKPTTALFLVGPFLAFAYRRRFAIAGAMLAGLVPALAALAVWKERGLGRLPLFSPSASTPGDGRLAAAAPLAGIHPGNYFNHLDWSHFLANLDLIREHFWSNRLIEWIVIAGLIALGRRSRTALILVGAWFAAFVIVKGSYATASIEDGSLFRVMMPSYPAFVLLIASLPLLLPRFPGRLRPWRPAFPALAPRLRWRLVGAAVLVSAVLPLAAFAAAGTGAGLATYRFGQSLTPVPANVDIGLRASASNGHVTLTWRRVDALGGPVFYRIWRGPADGVTCPPTPGARFCELDLPEVGTTHGVSFVDRPPKGRSVYRVLIAANWLDDAQFGDPYLVSRAVSVTVR